MLIKHLIQPAELRFEGKKTLGPNVFILSFKPVEPLTWQAGQQALLEIQLPSGRRDVESFPIATAPGEKAFKIATKINPDSPDAFKQVLFKLKLGEIINLRGIFGRTIIKDFAKEYAFLTIGIGIAVFRAVLKQLILDGQLDTKITLFFVGNKDNHYFKEELSSFKTTLRNLDIEYIYKPGRITGQVVETKMGKKLSDTTYFLAGSPMIVRNYRRILSGLGVADGLIKSNHYRLIRHHQHENSAKPAD